MNYIPAKIDPLVKDGIPYTKDYVEGLKQPLASIREALEQQERPYHALALYEIEQVLNYYCQIVKTE